MSVQTMASSVLKPGVLLLACGLASTTWSALTWLLMKSLHNRVEYFLVGPAQVLVIGAASVPLVFAGACFLSSQPRAQKLACSVGLALPTLLVLALICATLSG